MDNNILIYVLNNLYGLLEYILNSAKNDCKANYDVLQRKTSNSKEFQ